MSDQSPILLAKDREDDILLIRKAFAAAYITNPLHVVRDGVEAIAYLRGEYTYSNRIEFPLPDLLLLDLKMPRADGFEVLEWLRNQPSLSSLPVVVLTSSDHIRDVNRAYQLGANSFLVKPLEFQNLHHLAQTIDSFWLKANRTAEISRPIQVQTRDRK